MKEYVQVEKQILLKAKYVSSLMKKVNDYLMDKRSITAEQYLEIAKELSDETGMDVFKWLKKLLVESVVLLWCMIRMQLIFIGDTIVLPARNLKLFLGSNPHLFFFFNLVLILFFSFYYIRIAVVIGNFT